YWKAHQTARKLVLREWVNFAVNHSLKQLRESIMGKKLNIKPWKSAHCGRSISRTRLGIHSKLLRLKGNI
ncbi:hypothetical protein UlMin_025650, partial [Ulmus minor]